MKTQLAVALVLTMMMMGTQSFASSRLDQESGVFKVTQDGCGTNEALGLFVGQNYIVKGAPNGLVITDDVGAEVFNGNVGKHELASVRGLADTELYSADRSEYRSVIADESGSENLVRELDFRLNGNELTITNTQAPGNVGIGVSPVSTCLLNKIQ